uniref:chromophore lyase cpcS/cpeS n=1 Tax=Dixoniella grisea TaxID=35153 RepID=UPI001FCCD72B|nr:chromophore lyase cpcS/cpeS [Dixoniella grisea]UNJ17121.1 chromophore lyase cpcS/cpeS [Dixoniella grisea]
MNNNIIKFLQLNRGNWIIQNNTYNLFNNQSLQSKYQINSIFNKILYDSQSMNINIIFSISNDQLTDYFIIPLFQNKQYCSGIIIRNNLNCPDFIQQGSFLLCDNFSIITYFDNGQFQIYEKIWFEHINLRLRIQVIKEFGHSIFISFSSDIRKYSI